jgi:membrane associated rhomboid family serine protease
MYNNQYGFGGGYNPRQNFWEVIKQSFRSGTALTKLLYINVGVYLLVKVLSVFGWLMNFEDLDLLFVNYFAIPASTARILTQPWSLITYMFLHHGFMHIFFNMLWLFWFGRMFIQFIGNSKLVPVYLLGGLTGAAFFVLSYNIFPVFADAKYSAIAIGASASVMAVVFAVAFYRPNYRVNLIFIGPVKLIHIAIFSVVLDVLSIRSGNAGGHIAHLGGALYGYLYAVNYKKGHDITAFFVSITNSIANLFKKGKRPKMKVKYGNSSASKMSDRQYNARKKDEQERINKILDKISKSGYESLTKEEKELLFKSGRN